MTKLQVDQCRLSFDVEGPQEAPPLLLLNSLGTTTDLWKQQVDQLTPLFRVIRCDTRGHGLSDSPPGPYTLERLGRDALAVLAAANAPRAHVCGISLGGMVALWLAANAQERVDRVIAANTGATIGTPSFWNQRIAAVQASGLSGMTDTLTKRWFTDRFCQTDPVIVGQFRSMLSACTVEGYAGCCAALRDANLNDALARIAAPVLVINGANDEATPPEAGNLVQTRVGGARVVTLEAAHLSNVEQAGAFNATILSFLTNSH
tara:strand:+ start:8156 stop:8941 length:786 start_codon:yes stop_codon:yes gene_type:complete